MWWLSDLYGRGYSDAPQTTYDVSLYVTQLALLMQHIKWDQTRLVGVSMVCVCITPIFLVTFNDDVFWIPGWSNCGIIYGPIPATCKQQSGPSILCRTHRGSVPSSFTLGLFLLIRLNPYLLT